MFILKTKRAYGYISISMLLVKDAQKPYGTNRTLKLPCVAEVSTKANLPDEQRISIVKSGQCFRYKSNPGVLIDRLPRFMKFEWKDLFRPWNDFQMIRKRWRRREIFPFLFPQLLEILSKFLHDLWIVSLSAVCRSIIFFSFGKRWKFSEPYKLKISLKFPFLFFLFETMPEDTS